MIFDFCDKFYVFLKMKFSIQEEGQEKQIFFTFKEASTAMGIPSKVILRVLNSVESKYVRRADKKVFWIQREEKMPFIQIDGKDFFTAKEIQETFGLSRTVFFNQLCKKKTHFLDSQEKSHEVTWKSDKLAVFLGVLKEQALVGKMASELPKKNKPRFIVEDIKGTHKYSELESFLSY